MNQNFDLNIDNYTLKELEDFFGLNYDNYNEADLLKQESKLIRLENEKLIVDFSTQGGKVAAVYLKEFQFFCCFLKPRYLHMY